MKVGRNDPCPCGSGKKYKKCCLSASFAETGREESIRGQVIQDLLRFLKRNFSDRMDEASHIFWEEFSPEEHLDEETLGVAEINFFEWLVHDYVMDEENGKTLIDLYMESNRRLTADEHRVLNMMKSSVMSFYEVQEVFPERGLLIKDLLLGGEYDVREKMATRSVRKWDIFAGRLLHIDGIYGLSGSVYPYPLNQKEAILETLRGAFEDYRNDYPSATIDDFLKRESRIFNFFWYEPIQNPTPLKLVTTSGEPLLFSKAVFKIQDKGVAIEGLRKAKELDPDNGGFTWHDRRDEDEQTGTTVLGHIAIRGNNLVLSCNSKERLERGKELILEHTGSALAHETDSFEDPLEAMESLRERPVRREKDRIPPEVQQEIYTQFMQTHCEKWLTAKIPALDGRAPLQAIKTEEGKSKVIELLKTFENLEEHKRRHGEPFYDTSWMWGRLGLGREE